MKKISAVILLFFISATLYPGTVTIPKTWIASETLKAADLNANFLAIKGAIDVLQPDALPAGTVTLFSGTTLPDGYLWCDGSAISETVYADLYAAIGDDYTMGTEATGSFRLPGLASVTFTFTLATGTATMSYIIKY